MKDEAPSILALQAQIMVQAVDLKILGDLLEKLAITCNATIEGESFRDYYRRVKDAEFQALLAKVADDFPNQASEIYRYVEKIKKVA